MRDNAAAWVAGIAIASVFAVGGFAAPQTRDTGSRPTAATLAPSGTAVLTGTIVTDNGRPVRRATIRLTGSDVSGARIGVTDDSGRFAFTRLPAASFTITAAKTGYVMSYYGSKRPGRGPAVPVALAEGQRLAVSLTMMRGAVIAGTITDAFNRPAPQVTVQARALSSTGAPLPADTLLTMATTDDRGTYRIYGLAPGEYVLSALPPLPRAGSTGEALAVTDEEVQWARQQLSPNARPGVAAAAGMAAPLPPAGRALVYSPVYYPGTTELEAAAKITLGPGDERAGATFALQFVPTARIDGTVVGPDGQSPSGVLLMLMPKSAASVPAFQAMADFGPAATPRIQVANGAFSGGGVTPGQYTLVARTGVDSFGRAAGPGPTTLWGETDVSVSGSDLSGLVVALQPGIKVSGTVVFDATSLAQAADKSVVRVSLTPVRSGIGLMGMPMTTATPAGAFAFPSLIAASYTVKVIPPPAASGAPRWTLKSVMSGGRDITDGTLDLRMGEDVNGVVITFTDRETELSGTLLDAAGRPTPEFSIVVFTTNRAFWTAGSRRVQSVRPATNGTFKIAGLPAGEYAIAAVTDLEPGMLSDPAYLEQLQAAAITVTLAEGEKKKQDLRIK